VRKAFRSLRQRWRLVSTEKLRHQAIASHGKPTLAVMLMRRLFDSVMPAPAAKLAQAA